MADVPNQMVFRIKDTGLGISPDEKNKLFQPFEQGLAGISKGGSGLGLVITHEYVQLMGGKLSVESKPGRGSTFSFSYPFKAIHSPITEVNNMNKSAIGLKTGAGSRLALIVDDHQQSRSFMVQLLEMLGFRTLQADNGKQALAEFKAGHPDVILMDMHLPVMDGYEAIRRIRKLIAGKNIPIIAVTASIIGYDMNNIYACGADSALVKPCQVADITNALAKHAGIDFTYDENINDVDTVQELTATSISMLSNELRNKLCAATENGDIITMRNIVMEIKQTEPVMANGIANLVEQFNYDQLLELLEAQAS